MKKITLLLLITSFFYVNSQSLINITTSGGSYASEKWVNITTEIDGDGNQIWGQGDGTQCNGNGLGSFDISIAPGTYYVNCYDNYDDSWDGTLISVTAYGIVIGDNGGVSPDDGRDTDASSACEGTLDELEASFVIVVPEPPSCLGPTNISFSNITNSSANISWTAGGDETDYEYVLQPPGTGEPENAGTLVVGETSVSLSDLTSNTAYEVYLRSSCEGESSFWQGPFNFTTSPEPIVVDSGCMDFETGELGLNAGLTTNIYSNASVTAVAAATGSSYGVMLEGFDTAATFSTDVWSNTDHISSIDLLVDATSSEVVVLTFDLKQTYTFSSYYSTFRVTVDGVQIGSSLEALTSANDDFSFMNYDLSEYAGTTFNLKLEHVGKYSEAFSTAYPADAAYIDNICITAPSCVVPSDLAVSDILAEGATIAWTANNSETSWEYQVVESGATPSETGTVTSENPLVLSGYLDNTTYDFYIKSICTDGSFSDWVYISFTTTPLPIVPDYLNDFSIFPGDLWTEGQGSPDVGPSGTTSSWLADGFGNNGTTGAARVNIWSTSPDEWLISPNFDLSAMTYYLNLDAAATEYASTVDAIWGDDDYAALYVSTDGGVTWNEIYRWDRSNNPGAEGAMMPEIELTGYGIASFAIYGESTVSNEDIDFFVDNFSITAETQVPDCFVPSALSVVSITSDSVTISWTANNAETSWEYQVVETGATPADSGTTTSENPLTISSLTDNTSYDFYLRSICNDGSLSDWVSLSFTTNALPLVPDYLNDFSTFPGDLWTEGQGSPDVGPSGTTSFWVEDGFANNGFTGAAKMNIYSTGRDEWLISPDFDLSAMTYYLNLDAAATEYASTVDAIWASDDYAALLVTTDGGATWTEMYRWDANNNPRAAGAAMPEIELTGYGITKFAIYGESTVFDSEDIDFFIDNFSITSSTLSTNDLEVSQFTYFPNPVNDQLTIKAQSDVKDISVYNMLGQLVLRQVPNSLDCVVDMAAMQSGAYFVKVSIGNSVDTIRVLKK